jgi:hypothetical protein
MNKSKYKHVRLMLSKEQRIIFNKVTLLSQEDIDLLWTVFKNTKVYNISDEQNKLCYDWLNVLRIYTEDKSIEEIYKEQKIGTKEALNL